MNVIKPSKILEIERLARVTFSALPREPKTEYGYLPLWWSPATGEARAYAVDLAKAAGLRIGPDVGALIVSEGSIEIAAEPCVTQGSPWDDSHYGFISANTAQIMRHADSLPSDPCFHGMPRRKGERCGGAGGSATCLDWWPSCALYQMNGCKVSSFAERSRGVVP